MGGELILHKERKNQVRNLEKKEVFGGTKLEQEIESEIESVPPPREANLFASKRKTTGGSSTKGHDPDRPPPASHLSVLYVATQVEVPEDTLVVNIDQSAEAAAAVFIPPLERKKRSHKEGEKSSSKRSKREGSAPRPLSDGVFRPKFLVGHKDNFHMNSSEHAIVKELSEKGHYQHNSGDGVPGGKGTEDVQAKLVKERKTCAYLRARLKELTSELQLKLDEAKRERKEALEKARLTHIKGDRAMKEYKKLKGKMKEQAKKEAKLAIQNKAIAIKLSKVDEEIKALNESVVTEHEQSFNKALCQGFDVMKEVHEGNLIPLSEMLGNFGLDEMADDEGENAPEEVLVDVEGDDGIDEE
ncbi:hypothetical protein V8G54_034508 [Vigna mungo]|uniref:Uncharacterized protein n=1 Tax=Vigna mungo TaxID=3915 RepID=A0AAQ3MQT2_VIGMU